MPQSPRNTWSPRKSKKGQGKKTKKSRRSNQDDDDDDDDEIERNPSDFPFPSFQPSSYELQRKKENALAEIRSMKAGSSSPVVAFKRPDLNFERPTWRYNVNVKHEYIPQLDMLSLKETSPSKALSEFEDGEAGFDEGGVESGKKKQVNPPWINSLKRVVAGCPQQGLPIIYENTSAKMARLDSRMQLKASTARSTLPTIPHPPTNGRGGGQGLTDGGSETASSARAVSRATTGGGEHLTPNSRSFLKKKKLEQTQASLAHSRNVIGGPKSKREEYDQLLLTPEIKAQIREQCVTPEAEIKNVWTHRAKEMEMERSKREGGSHSINNGGEFGANQVSFNAEGGNPMANSKRGHHQRKSVYVSLPKIGVRMFSVAVDEDGKLIE